MSLATYSTKPSGPWSGYANQEHLTHVYYLANDATSATDIKSAMIDYGGIAIAYYHNDAYYDATNHTYNYTGGSASNHEVLAIGWDDNFDKTLFSPDAAANGAWIVKNSWGTTWGDNGYFYLSYGDASLSDGSAFIVEPVTNYDRIYDYDPLGAINGVGYTNPTAWFANIFTAGNGRSSTSEQLAAVSFYTFAANSAYEVYIYTGVTANQPRSGTLAFGGPLASTIVSPGYHTVVLPTLVPLTNGQLFSVVVKLTSPGLDFPIAYEYAMATYSENATANPGESFTSSTGVTWSDLTTYDATANVCLKAFTTTSTVTPTPTTTVTPTVTHAPTVTGGGSSGGGGCTAGMFAPFALLLFVPLFLKKF